jgi:hypothetical protein
MNRIFIALAILLMTLSSCYKEEHHYRCELYNYGNVTVENLTYYNLWVDVTERFDEVNNEVLLYDGESCKYLEIKTGKVYIWASFDGYDWVYDTEYIYECENLIYTWYSTGLKSTDKSVGLRISKNGDIIKNITEFKKIKR